jgi:hypothetical protein
LLRLLARRQEETQRWIRPLERRYARYKPRIWFLFCSNPESETESRNRTVWIENQPIPAGSIPATQAVKVAVYDPSCLGGSALILLFGAILFAASLGPARPF